MFPRDCDNSKQFFMISQTRGSVGRSVINIEPSPLPSDPSMKPRFQFVGTQFLRFIIGCEDGTFWTGTEWTRQRSKAMLYAHLEIVRADIRMLKRRRKPQ